MAHNLVYFDSSTNSIQKFSNAQLDDLAERVLRVMAAGTYTGTITVGTTASIGTFADTALVDASGGTNTTTVTNTYTLSQVATATLGATSDPPMYVGLDNTTNVNQVVLQENLTTREQLADEIIARMVASTGGTNAYYLATAAPSDGATWVSRGTILNTITNLTVTVTDYKLWHRTTSGATITNRDPVKLSSGNIQSWTTAEINALIKTIEARIIATGIGTYSIQATAPATGTWTNVGTVVDTREDIATSNFTGAAGYLNENALTYTSTYVGTRTYTGDDAASFTATYAGPVTYTTPATYTNENSSSFSGTYAGPVTYAGPATYAGPVSYAGPATYAGPVTYSGPQTFTNPDWNSFTNPDVNNFTNPDAITFTNADASGPFLGPIYTSVTRTATYTGGPFNFSPGVIPTPQGVAPQFFGTRNFTRNFTSNFQGSYFGPIDYYGPIAYFGPVTYLGPQNFINPDALAFTNPDASPFTNPDALSFVNPDAASFINANALSYLNENSASYVGPAYLGPVNFAGFAGFTNPDATGYVAPTYLGPANFITAFTSFDGTNYTGPSTYDSTPPYEGTRVGATTSTITTRILWRRVA
jgi:hypothetical protein